MDHFLLRNGFARSNSRASCAGLASWRKRTCTQRGHRECRNTQGHSAIPVVGARHTPKDQPQIERWMKLGQPRRDRLEEFSKMPTRPLAERQTETAFLAVVSLTPCHCFDPDGYRCKAPKHRKMLREKSWLVSQTDRTGYLMVDSLWISWRNLPKQPTGSSGDPVGLQFQPQSSKSQSKCSWICCYLGCSHRCCRLCVEWFCFLISNATIAETERNSMRSSIPTPDTSETTNWQSLISFSYQPKTIVMGKENGNGDRDEFCHKILLVLFPLVTQLQKRIEIENIIRLHFWSS